MSIKSYQEGMGQLIDLSNPTDFALKHDPRSKNIPYQRLMMHYKEYLNKNEAYYLICSQGVHSSKAVQVLEYLGYDVTQVVNNG